MAKFTKVGSITKNKDSKGKTYHKMVLDKSFLDNAPSLIKQAYPLKDGGRSFYLFEPKSENAPSFLVFDICVKGED